MPVGDLTFFARAKSKIWNGVINIGTHTFKAALTTSAQALTATFAGTSTDCRYSDLTAQVANGNGYTTGGITLTLTENLSGTVHTVDSTVDPAWAASTITAKYLVIYDDTPVNKPLICFADLDTGGGSVSTTNGTFQITFASTGLWTS